MTLILAAAGFVVVVLAIGRAVSAIAPRDGSSRQYLAGRLDGVRIASLVECDDELLVSLTAPAGVFRITASACSLARVKRWRDESTPLRAYLSRDGAIMLAEPVLGGNAACEPSMTVPEHLPQLEVMPDSGEL